MQAIRGLSSRFGAGAYLLVQRQWQTAPDISSADPARRNRPAKDGFCNFPHGSLLAVTAVAEKQDTLSGLFAGRCVASVNQLLKFRVFFYIQTDVCMPAHTVQHTCTE